jgi:hypothetical protein
MNPLKFLTNPPILYSRSAVLSKHSPVPTERGLYAWFFKETPGITPTDGCVIKDNLTLLYVGISPKNETSKENLLKRITYHYRGNAEGSNHLYWQHLHLSGNQQTTLVALPEPKHLLLLQNETLFNPHQTE